MSVYSDSVKGLRPSNEDKHVTIMNNPRTYPNLRTMNFMAVFDGHGGKAVSEFLSNNLPPHFVSKHVKYPLSMEYINKVFNHLQNALRRSGKAEHTGSTALVAIDYIMKGQKYLNIMNVGDCRCVLSRDLKAIPLTVDHKPNYPAERKRIERLGGNIIFDNPDFRINGLSVSRAFGDLDAAPYVSHVPEIFKYKLTSKDQFIVIACDGLWDVLSNQEVVNFVINNCYDGTLTKRVNRRVNIAKKLTNYALERGTGDNVSVIVYFFHN